MKKPVLLILVLVIVAVGAYFLLTDHSKPASQEDKPQPIAITSKSGAFDESFSQMLQAYYNMSTAFANSDTLQANAAAGLLMAASDSLKIDDIKGDSTGTIRSLVGDLSATVVGSCKALQGESGLEEKRREYQMISTAMWDLLRTSRYGGQKVYKLYCPMAFDNTGAEWLSAGREINNPYFGSKMPHCGSVEDSLDYSAQ